MKMWLKHTICISLSLMCLCACIGFAVLSKNLVVSGEMMLVGSEPEGIYISDVKVYSTSGISSASESIIYPTSLQTNANVTSQSASITYEITVYNKTDMTYWYLGTEVANEVGSNSLINTTNGIAISTKDGSASNSTAFDTNDWIPPQTERVFYATYVFGSRAQGNISTMVNFSFGLHMGSVSDAFLKVLNDKTSAFGYYYLADAFNKNYAENGSTVVGNIGDDEEVFNHLFGSSLTINVDGVDLPVTILVERKNVDGKSGTGDAYTGNGSPTGCEYTVYVTVDDLSSNGSKATVYAVSYSCGPDGTWYMIGELYEGRCTVEDYENSNDPRDDAFDVDSWIATQKEYTVIDNVTYKVGYTQQGTEYDRYNTIELLMSKFDQEFYNKVNNNSAKFLQTVCKTVYSYKQSGGGYIESENYANAANPGYADLKMAFDRIKPYCLIANGAQEVKLTDSARNLSRAEIIQILENIKTTYDYYLAVNTYN